MKTVSIFSREHVSSVYVGASLKNIEAFLPNTTGVIITDSVVRQYYGDLFPDRPVLEISLGEKSKTLETATLLYEAFMKLGLDRTSFVLGIGGGIVCDLAGFCASTYMRGIDVGLVPTTLLAQVDASVGGKNGVNFDGYKNMIGTFSLPQFVLCDPALLASLPEETFRCGLTEMIKIALVRDAGFFEWLGNHMTLLRKRDPHSLEEAIYQAIRLKADIVMEDETEKGVRRLLNLGHTFGHAIEKEGSFSHGDAVAIGIVIASKMAAQLHYLSMKDVNRIEHLLEEAGLPTYMPKEMASSVFDAMLKDKKKENDQLHFILLNDYGKGIDVIMPFSQIEEIFHAVC